MAATSPEIRQLRLLLTPHFDDDGAATGLLVKRTLYSPGFQSGDVVCQFDGTELRISASDAQGDLPLFLKGDRGSHEWQTSRDTKGDVTLEYAISAAGRDGGAIPASQGVSLQQDLTGLTGVGRGFLVRLASNTGSYRHVVEWDLSSAPEGTRAVWSFGEGPEPNSREGPEDVLLNSVFMAGPIQSFPLDKPPPESSSTGGDGEGAERTGFCGTYWFGNLPENLDALKDFSSKMFPRMSAFFRDEQGSYRLFLRRVPRGLRGGIYERSGIVDYDGEANRESDYDLVRLLNHQMVGSWAQLDDEEDGTNNEWMMRGFAQLYSIFLPFRFGQRTPDYFRRTINGFLTAYYTNPQVGTPVKELLAAQSSSPSDLSSQSWYTRPVLYMRCMLYMLKMDSYTRRASRELDAGVLRPIDEILGEISARRRAGDKVRTADWLRYLGDWFGQDAAETHFRDLMAGTRVEMDDMISSFGDKDGPVQVEMDALSFGFDLSSLDEGGGDNIVTGLVEGSVAAEAGLGDGDRVVWYSPPLGCAMDETRKFELVVDRGGEKVKIEYRPRLPVKVKGWQVVRFVE